jgi:hypothetical protein
MLARKIYKHWLSARLFIAASLALPIAVILVAADERVRWLGAGCLLTAIVNVSAVVAVRRRGELPAITLGQGKRVLKRKQS